MVTVPMPPLPKVGARFEGQRGVEGVGGSKSRKKSGWIHRSIYNTYLYLIIHSFIYIFVSYVYTYQSI